MRISGSLHRKLLEGHILPKAEGPWESNMALTATSSWNNIGVTCSLDPSMESDPCLNTHLCTLYSFFLLYMSYPEHFLNKSHGELPYLANKSNTHAFKFELPVLSCQWEVDAGVL
jgi:hypothetical protein